MKVKRLLPYKYFGLLFFPLIIALLVWQEADAKLLRDLSQFFPKDALSNQERVIYFAFSEDKDLKITIRQQKEMARAIVRSADRLDLPDGTTLGGLLPSESLFLFVISKIRSNHGTNQIENGKYGILSLSEKKIKDLETKTGSMIDRKFDIYNYNIQYKIAIILFKEALSTGLTTKQAYFELFDLPSNSDEWNRLETYYVDLHKKLIVSSE
jgi:hypothetical protein